MPKFSDKKVLYRLLYINSDLAREVQFQSYFNPPNGMKESQIAKYNLGVELAEQHRFICKTCFNYDLARQIIGICNFDEVAQKHGFIPFDFVLFELELNGKKGRLNWIDFLDHVFALRVSSLFPFGPSSLMAICPPNSPQSLTDLIGSYGIRYLQRPFTLEYIKVWLLQHLMRLEGSALNPFIHSSPSEIGNTRIFQRSIRYQVGSPKTLASIALPYLEQTFSGDQVVKEKLIIKRNEALLNDLREPLANSGEVSEATDSETTRLL